MLALVARSLPWLAAASLARFGGDCEPHWRPCFDGHPGTTGVLNALAVFDDGGGARLFAAGPFVTTAGGVPVERIASHDGERWWPLAGGGVTGTVYALAAFDDGGGSSLYAAGNFAEAGGIGVASIAAWDGAGWSALGAGVRSASAIGTVMALAVFDDGNGPALYAGGWFDRAGTASASHIARWDGSSWSPLGAGVNNTVRALCVFDDGGGDALYACGEFTAAGGAPAQRVARWDGSSWTPLGAGLDLGGAAAAVFDDGSGPALYVGGSFASAGGAPASRVARWDGSSWSALGAGVDGSVLALAVHDDGGGPALYAAGGFASAGGAAASKIARWDGAAWSALASGITGGGVNALASFDGGAGPELWAAGSFEDAGGVLSKNVARWDGAAWSPLSRGMTWDVEALRAFDDGGGPALYAGGPFTVAGGDVAANRIARWDGAAWSPLGAGVANSGAATARVDALAAFGGELFAGGTFDSAGGAPAANVARWDGAAWAPAGAGLDGPVHALETLDLGAGPELYAGGSFERVPGGVALNGVARWNGAGWSRLWTGVSGWVHALAAFDDGGGTDLYVGGGFSSAGGAAATSVARWNGASWSAVGTLHPAEPEGFVRVLDLVVFDDGLGDGPALYAGGSFGQGNVARWNGTSWVAVGDGLWREDAELLARVEDLEVFDDGSGPALYACGTFERVGGTWAEVRNLARWDGKAWRALGAGTNGEVLALTSFDDRSGAGPALYAGGGFTSALDSRDSYVARWQGCDTLAPLLECPELVRAADSLLGAPGEVVTFQVGAMDASDSTPHVVCVPPSGSVFPRGTTLVTCTATDDAGNESTCTFEVEVTAKARRR